MRKIAICLAVVVGFASSAFSQDNTLSKKQQQAGWIRLFDGKSSKGWKGAFKEGFPKNGWEIKDGMMIVQPSDGKESVNGGDIVTIDLYSDFELLVDFKLTDSANSGIKYFVDPAQPVPENPRSALGLEYQVLDDATHPDAKLGRNGNRTLGSLYDLMPAPGDKPVAPIGEWNHARIISKGDHVEHWLNDTKLLEYDRGSAAFKELIAISKYKDLKGFGTVKAGRILLQDHGNKVYFKNIYLRKL